MEVNTRIIMAFREIGLGHEAVKTFCGMMNMPPPMNKKSYDITSSKLHDTYVQTAQDSMKTAANEIRQKTLDVDGDTSTIVDTRVILMDLGNVVVTLP